MTLVLGIETSCDETAAAVVEDGRIVRSSLIASQHDLHEEFGGVVPEIASRAHAERITPILRGALKEAGVERADLDAIAVGNRPGLIGSLLVGLSAAKALAWALGRPLIGVDHVQAHLYAPLLEDAQGFAGLTDAEAFPALGLVVSGGHSSIYALRSPMDVERLGRTIDDAMGEAFDKAAAILGLGFPGGPALDRLAQTGDAGAHDFPVSRIGPGSLDFSFSGLKTAVLYAARGKPRREGGSTVFERDASELSEKERADLAASFQRAAVDAAVLKLGRAMERVEGARSLLVGGGVSANSALRAALEGFAKEKGVRLGLAPMRYCLDNAAMIAGLGSRLLAEGRVDDLSLRAAPTGG